MRLLRWIAATVVLAPLSPLSTPATAQQPLPLRVIRHVPPDTSRSGDVIAISFDRPVATSVDRAPDPRRFVRIDPPVPAIIQWRDPVTIRIIPNEPLRPASRYKITVGNSFSAQDRGRLKAPYTFTLNTRGPRLVSRAPSMIVGGNELFEPNGKVTLVYSAPVDTAELSRVARLEIAASPSCIAQTIHFRAKAERPTAAAEAERAASASAPSVLAWYETAIQLESEAPLPDGCMGAWVIPSFDPADNPEIRYRAATMLPFRVGKLECTDADCAVTPALRLQFTAPVRWDLLARSISIEPQVPFTIDQSMPTAYEWVIRLSVRMHTTYRVRFDSTLKDTYGRRLTGLREMALSIGDRRPALGHQLGFFTLPRQSPVLRIAHINVDSVDLTIVPVPDSLRVAVVLASVRPDSVARIIGRLRDSVHHVVALPRSPNVQQLTELVIPQSVLNRYPGALLALRARAIWNQISIPDTGSRKPGELPIVQIVGTSTEFTRQVALVQLTDLLAHAKVDDAWGSVFVTDVNNGRPVVGAAITLRDAAGGVSATGTTDVAGVADLQRDPQWREASRAPAEPGYWYPGFGYARMDSRLVEVTRGKDRTLTLISPYSREAHEMDVGYPDYSYDRKRFLRAMVYTERPIYRPAEKTYIGVLIREGWLNELTVPRRDSVRLRIESTESGPNDSETIRDTVLRLTDFGSAVDSFTIPRAATLGEYMIRLDAVVDSSWQTVAWTGLRVAEYRAPEFKTTVTLDSAIRFLGDTIRGHVSGRYYFGAAMAGAQVSWSASTSDDPSRLTIPDLPPGFVIGHGYFGGPDNRSSGEQMSGVDTLDATGAVALAIPTKAGTLNGPGRFTVDVGIVDASRQPVIASASTPVHASAYYVAVRDTSRGWYWAQDVPRSFDVVAVRPDGRRVRGVSVEIVVLRHQYVWSPRADGSSTAWVTDTILRDAVVTSDSLVRFRYTPRTNGSHQVLFTIRDDHGRPLTTSVGRYVVSSGVSVAWGPTRASVSMHLMSDTVAVGDTLRVQFISPFDRAEAWVTIEREGMLAQRRLTVLRGETTVPFVVTERLAPGGSVAVLLVDSVAASKTDSLHERLRSARAVFSVAPSTRRLTVDVVAEKDRYEPGDSARFSVRLRDHLMRPVAGEVTLWAVDESVLALADYETPDPFTVMYSPRGSGLAFGSTAAILAQRQPNLTPPGWVHIRGINSLSSAVVTGTGVQLASVVALRSNFRTTAFFVAGLRTNATGVATTNVKLPDNLTTYRVIAVAGTADSRFGGGTASLLVTKPLLARAALPRFVRGGDRLLAGAVLTNQTGKRASVNLRASGKGVSLDGDIRVTRPLGPDSTAEVRFDWRAAMSENDSAAFRFDLDGGGYGDAVQVSLPVRPQYSPRFHTVTGVARGTTTVRMFLPPELDPARSRLTLRVGMTPAPIIRSNYWRMRVYPYQCTEQLSSTGQVVIAMLKLQRAGLVDSMVAPHPSELRRDLQIAVDELSRRQTGEGGIGYWGSSDWTSPRLTTYAGTMLLAARELGLQVRPRTLAGITGYLSDVGGLEFDTTYRTRDERRRTISVNVAEHLARLQFLRRAGDADTAAERQVSERERDMFWEDRVLLAELLAARGDTVEGRAVLARAWKSVEIAGKRLDVADSLLTARWFPSRVRPVAQLLRATLALDPADSRIPLGIETVVSQERAGRGWMWNTHDYAAASSALTDIAIWQRSNQSAGAIVVRSAERRHRDQVLITGLVGAGSDSTISLRGLVERDGDWLALPLRVDASDRAVFYSLTVEEVPTSLPTRPDAKGIIVERWFERFDNGRPATEVKEGEMVRGRLRITIPSNREFVAVEDLLPAGLEVVDLSLKTSSTLGPLQTPTSKTADAKGAAANHGQTRYGYGTWYGNWWSPWEHQEIRDDRVVYFARELEKGTYVATYVARATTAGTFIRPPAHAEEMYNQSLGGRSEGGIFRIVPK